MEIKGYEFIRKPVDLKKEASDPVWGGSYKEIGDSHDSIQRGAKPVVESEESVWGG